MGMKSFLKKLEVQFLNELDPKDIPKHLDVKDKAKVRAWVDERFAHWFMEHRDELLGKEFVRRGWAEPVLTAPVQGDLDKRFRVKPECVEKIDAWMQDEMD